MNNILRYSQLARALGVTNASISMAIKNGKLIPEEKVKSININDPLNKIWIESQIQSGKKFDINRIYDKQFKPKPQAPKEEQEENEINYDLPEINSKDKSYNDLKKIELDQKKATLKKTKYEAKKLELQNYKLEGKLIPTDAVETVFIYTTELSRSTYLQEVNSLANIFVERLGGSHNHFIELQKELTDKVNEIHKLVKDSLLNGLDGIIEEYKEIRSRGERE